jgi:hypothetical protein
MVSFSSNPRARSLLKQVGHSSKSTNGEKVKFEAVAIPRFGRFDLYASNVENETSPPYYTIVTRADQDTKGSSFVARLNYGRLGRTASLRRVLSTRHPIIYIGPVVS